MIKVPRSNTGVTFFVFNEGFISVGQNELRGYRRAQPFFLAIVLF